MTTEARVCAAVETVLGLPAGTVGPESSRDTLEDWDSINIVNMMIVLEAEFGVAFDPEEAEQFLSIPLIVAILRDKGVAG